MIDSSKMMMLLNSGEVFRYIVDRQVVCLKSLSLKKMIFFSHYLTMWQFYNDFGHIAYVFDM